EDRCDRFLCESGSRRPVSQGEYLRRGASLWTLERRVCLRRERRRLFQRRDQETQCRSLRGRIRDDPSPFEYAPRECLARKLHRRSLSQAVARTPRAESALESPHKDSSRIAPNTQFFKWNVEDAVFGPVLVVEMPPLRFKNGEP